MRRKCDRLVSKAMKAAAKRAGTSDVIIGANRPLGSVCDTLLRKHGSALPVFLGDLLEKHGLIVEHEVKLPIYESALALVRDNTVDRLNGIRCRTEGQIAYHYTADLLYFARRQVGAEFLTESEDQVTLIHPQKLFSNRNFAPCS